jgi:hypothetical protein
MAKKRSGDWRDPEQVGEFALDVFDHSASGSADASRDAIIGGYAADPFRRRINASKTPRPRSRCGGSSVVKPTVPPCASTIRRSSSVNGMVRTCPFAERDRLRLVDRVRLETCRLDEADAPRNPVSAGPLAWCEVPHHTIIGGHRSRGERRRRFWAWTSSR